ncbi:hypothetical protein PPROV_000669300 [Pycnococcus provasolii]|uniref:Protease Do-like PDZ domain-containing protein n=2 Tax=Pycnococcus provasolii TaxID=41880 RepID=A0A830HR80_9CHLO|nr:hypothetical protein PPROV_000669300 [Pycnococcus provasolii]
MAGSPSRRGGGGGGGKNKAGKGAGGVGGPGGAKNAPGSPQVPAQVEAIRAGVDQGVDVEDAMLAMTQHEALMDGVVKIFCTHTEPNFSLPWQRKRQYQSTSTGFVIEKKRILTNAHAVEFHTQVKVKRRGSDTKYVANVLAIGTECDLALLEVEDAEFWKGLPSIQLGPLPRLQDNVVVIGYPIGGDTISVTSGVVSRIEVTSYVHGSSELLGVQIDAAINSGNSGGPSFYGDGTCAGVAFQSLKSDDAENIGYIIPTPIVNHFIQDYEANGRFTGFPTLGIEWQKMESPALRAAMGMKHAQKGVLVRRLEPTGSTARSAGKLTPPVDISSGTAVLLEFDGIKIANDGTVPFRSGERIAFSYLVSKKMVGETAKLKLLLGGDEQEASAGKGGGGSKKRAERTVDVTLRCARRVVPPHSSRYMSVSRGPSYLIVAGLVFTVATVPYLKSEYGKEYDYEAPVKLLDRLLHGMADAEDQQLVVLAHVLACPACFGYEDIVNTAVHSFDGKPLRNLKQLRDGVMQSKQKWLTFGLEYQQTIVLSREAAMSNTEEVLTMHAIPSAMSADLMDDANGDAAAAPLDNGTNPASGSGKQPKRARKK